MIYLDLKLLLSSLLILSVLIIGISQADAYEGKIDVSVGVQNEDYYQGDLIPVEIRLIGDLEYVTNYNENPVVEKKIMRLND